MIDRRALSRWIQPRHLERGALVAAREAFEAHPARLVALRGYLRPELADSVHAFLAREAEYKPRYGLYSAAGTVSGETWENAREPERFFRFGKLAGVREDCRLSRHLMSFMKLRAALVDSRFRAYLERITGMSLGLSSQPYAHAFGPADFLKIHDDDNENRCLTLVLYLSRNWQPEMGGAFHMIDPNGDTEVLEAEYNSLVLFDVTANTRHFIAPIHPTARELRLSIGCWFHRPSRPGSGSSARAQAAG